MSKYWTTVKHYKTKQSFLTVQHIWRHTLRYGRTTVATWTVTDLSPGTVADWRHIVDGKNTVIRIAIQANQNQIKLYPVNHPNLIGDNT